ncbi:hypothetical protein Aduo_000855 [Ancylostoma duodenale]
MLCSLFACFSYKYRASELFNPNSSLQSYIMDVDPNSMAIIYTAAAPPSAGIPSASTQLVPQDTDGSYVFARSQAAAGHVRYYCVKCKELEKCTGISVVDDEFLSDACALSHVCNPLDTAQNLASRASYEVE